MLVGDNERVTAGQVLARIGDGDLRAALDEARAQVAAAEASIRIVDAQLVLQRSIIDQQARKSRRARLR